MSSPDACVNADEVKVAASAAHKQRSSPYFSRHPCVLYANHITRKKAPAGPFRNRAHKRVNNNTRLGVLKVRLTSATFNTGHAQRGSCSVRRSGGRWCAWWANFLSSRLSDDPDSLPSDCWPNAGLGYSPDAHKEPASQAFFARMPRMYTHTLCFLAGHMCKTRLPTFLSIFNARTDLLLHARRPSSYYSSFKTRVASTPASFSLPNAQEIDEFNHCQFSYFSSYVNVFVTFAIATSYWRAFPWYYRWVM